MCASRAEQIAIYDRMSAAELAIIIGLGGTLPPQSWHRYGRLLEATRLIREDGISGTPKRSVATDKKTA